MFSFFCFFLFAHQPRMCGYCKKESVRLFVYPTIGIWRSPSTNKQYLTPNGIWKRIYQMRCRVLLLTLVLVKSPNFIVKVSETLSLIICLQSRGLHYKFRNYFR